MRRQTFDSARKAAVAFYRANELFFAYVRDPVDGLRAWADGIDVRSGRATRRLVDTKAGRAILGAPQGAPQIQAALRWVFGRAKGRRWDAVDWGAIDRLEELIEPYFEAPDREASMPGIYWRPVDRVVPFSERTPQQLAMLDADEAVALAEKESRLRLQEAVSDLRTTYSETRDCLSPALRRKVEIRIAEWSKWARDPEKVPEYACEPDASTGGYVCDWPLVTGELRELRGACRHAYDPDWLESQRDEPGFPPSADLEQVEQVPELVDAPVFDPETPAAGERPDAPTPEEPPQTRVGDCPIPTLRMTQDDGIAFGAPRRNVAETRQVGKVWYQHEYRTRSGRDYGPYWYAYWRTRTGERTSHYIGNPFRTIDPDAIEDERAESWSA